MVWLAGRYGPRPALALAAISAAAGMAVIAGAQDATGLAVGVLVAGSAAGFTFPPYADVVPRAVAAAHRAPSRSAISSGTEWGVALAGLATIAVGVSWRVAWLVFAGLTVVVGVVAVRAAPAGAPTPGPAGPAAMVLADVPPLAAAAHLRRPGRGRHRGGSSASTPCAQPAWPKPPPAVSTPFAARPA